MDIDQVVDVPDTPDRLASRKIIGRGSVTKDCNSSLAGNVRNLESMDGPSSKGKLVTKNGHCRKIIIHPPKCGNFERRDCNNSNGFSSVEDLSAAQNAHLFRKAAIAKGLSQKAKQSIEGQNMDKGKPMCSKFRSKSPSFNEGTTFSDLTKQNGHSQRSRKAIPHGESKYLVAEEMKRGQIISDGSSSVNYMPDSVKTSINAFKGKGKIEDNSVKSPSTMAHGKRADLSSDSQYISGEQMYVSHPVTSPRVSGQKRLVRNGCISPLNIEMKAKQLAEQQSNSSKNVEQNQTENVDSNHHPPSFIDLSSTSTKDENSETAKGKTVVIDPYASKECTVTSDPPSSR